MTQGKVVPSKRGGARPGAGRPKGSRSRVNLHLREHLVNLTGRDAIVEQYRLASLPLLDDDEAVARAALAKIARRFRCSRVMAAELWLKAAHLVYPHLYPKLGVLELRPGAPGNPLDAESLFGVGSALIDGDFADISDQSLIEQDQQLGDGEHDAL